VVVSSGVAGRDQPVSSLNPLRSGGGVSPGVDTMIAVRIETSIRFRAPAEGGGSSTTQRREVRE
jgi:hypothetical protein